MATLDNIFFLAGPPKSGTTWAQQLLQAHPDITCHPEQLFHFYIDHLPPLVERYNQSIAEIDNRTAQQGAVQYSDSDVTELFRFLVLLMLGKGGTKLRGVKDNSIISDLRLYRVLFPDAKYVFTLRDPRDVAVSSWFHNIRVEEGFRERAGTLQVWCSTAGKAWRNAIEDIEADFWESERAHFIKYEDLCRQPGDTVFALLEFLGADTDKQLIDCILEKTRFSKKQGTGNQFYRKGKVGDWRDHLSDEMVAAMWDECGEHAEWYGYKI